MPGDPKPVHSHSDPLNTSSSSPKPNSVEHTVAQQESQSDGGLQIFNSQRCFMPGNASPTASQSSATPGIRSSADFCDHSPPGGYICIAQQQAREYIETIKRDTGENSKEFKEFSKILQLRMNHSLTDSQMVQRVIDLFIDFPHLLEGFTIFLQGYDARVTYKPTAVRLIDERGRKTYFYPRKTSSGTRDLARPPILYQYRTDIPGTLTAVTAGKVGQGVESSKTSRSILRPPMRKEARIPTWLVQSLQASGTAANSSEASVRKPEIVPAPSEPSSPGRQCISSNMEKRPEEMRQTNPSFQLRLGEPKWMSRVNRTTHPTLYASSMDFISHVKARFAEEPERYRKIVGVIQKLGHFGTPKQQIVATVSRLLNSEPDLLDEFYRLFPFIHVKRPANHDGNMAHKSSPPKRRALPRTPAPVFEAETEPPPPPPPPPPSTMKPAPCDKPSPIVAPILKYVQSPVFESSNADPPPSIWVPPDLTPLPESELSSDLGPLSSCEVSPRLDPLSSVSVTTESAAYPQALHIEDSTTHSHLPQSMESDCYNSDSDSADNDIFPTSIITMEDIEMHRLIRKHINRHNRSYKEYLKLITLYTNGIFDADLIIKHAKPFIGDNPLLFQWLKSIVNYQLSTNEDIHQPRRLTPKPALHTCETINDSPSYRRVPSEWESQPCSGRDGLCQEVLNDKYVSYPRWNREDSDFPASKKNIFEDGMHNCEEARYSFDIVLDALQSAIAALELLLKSPPAESIVLDTVVRISVKLVYGPQRAHEIERLLGLYFAEAAPTVLDRLRQKSKEWKQAQYELLPVWRENDTKNYYRALDYAGGAFRTSDRKATTLKAMVADIRALSEKGGHYIFSFSDLDIFQDIFRISLVHASRQLSAGEHQTIQLFFQEVFAFIFHIQCNQVHAHCDQTRLQAATAPPPSVVDDDDSEEYDDARSTLSDMVSESAATSDNQTLFVKHDDLDRSARYAEKRNATIASEFLDALRTPNRQKQFRFFCDTTFYCFFRTLQLVYERLRGLKQLDKPRRLNSIALKLGLYGDHVPESESCYNRMLTIVESLFMGDINHNTFEEQLRVLFITQAYPLFTIDKIISNLTKSVLALTTEWRAVDLVRLFLQGPTPDYRQRAMDIIRPEESLFDVEVDIDARTLTMKTVSETPP